MRKPFMQDSSDGKSAEIVIEGVISDEMFWGDEYTPEQIRDELAAQANGRPITVILNSPGGSVFAGSAIYNALREYEGEVTVRVDGLAASMGSVIAMAGNRVLMSPGSTMMVHRASVMAFGNVDDMNAAINLLEAVEDTIMPIYEKRTGKSRSEIAELLAAETWMSAQKAVELGFADEVIEDEENVFDKVKAMLSADKFALSMSAVHKSLENYVAEAEEESQDVDKSTETKAEAEITPSDEEKPETKQEPEVEDEAETTTEETKPAKEETMSKEDTKVKDIAKEQVETKVEKPAVEGTIMQKGDAYLKSKKAVSDFGQVLFDNAGKSASEVKAAWEAHAAKMGVTNPEVLLPGALVERIQDAFDRGGEIWNLVNKTGRTVLRVDMDTATGEGSRAKGWNRADATNGEKTEQTITLADRVIRAQYIYKYIRLNKEDVRENQDTGALVSYVLTELPQRIVRELERAIVLGDGRAPGSEFKIDSFLSIKEDAASGDGYATEYVADPSDSFLQSVIKADAEVKAPGARYLVTSREKLTELRLSETSGGGFVFPFGSDLAGALGFAGIITPDWFEDEAVDAVIVTFSNYDTVGDSGIEAFTNFELKTNQQEYLQEVYAGGALTEANAAVTIGDGGSASS